MHLRLGVNVRHADQQLRGTLFLPHGTGRDGHRGRVRPGREGQGGRGRRRRLRRRRRPGRPRAGGLHRLRRRHRHARHDGHGRPAGPHPRPAGQDAEPEGGHDHLRHRRRPSSRHQGRQDRVPHRPHRASSTSRSARSRSRRRRWSRTTAPCWTRSCAPSRRRRRAATCARSRITSTMGPGVKVDTGRIRDLLEESGARRATCGGYAARRDKPALSAPETVGAPRAQTTHPTEAGARARHHVRSRRLTADARSHEGGEPCA